MSGGHGTNSSEIPQQIAKALTNSARADLVKVGIATGVFTTASVATVAVFEAMRHHNKKVYEPKRKYADAGAPAPPQLGHFFLGWMGPVWRYTEAEMLATAGLDAVVFLRFLRLCSLITTVLAAVLCAALIPIDVVYNLRYKPQQLASKSTALSVMTLAEMHGGFLYAHIAMSYVCCAVALVAIFDNYKYLVGLRWAYFRSEAYQRSFAARTLLLTNVGKPLQSDEALSKMLASIGLPYATTEVHIGRHVGMLTDLIEAHDDNVRKLERLLARYLRNSSHIPSKRPTIRVKKTVGMFGGRRVDAIDYHTTEISRLGAAVNQWRGRIGERRPESYGFASLASVPHAHAAARTLKGKKPYHIKTTLAPEPRDILWKNLSLTRARRMGLSATGFVYLVIVLWVNVVPLLAVALVAQMASFTRAIRFLEEWQAASSWSFNVVAGMVPPAISGALGYILPLIMRKIAKFRGERTRTDLDKVVTGQYFTFLIISQFVLFSVIGIAISSAATVIQDISRHTSAALIFHTLREQTVVLKKQFINTSNYWLTWMPMRMWQSTYDLAQGHKLILVWLHSIYFGRTPRDAREFTKPPHFEYAIYYGNFLFVFAVGAVYGCLVPLVMVFTAVVFWVSLGCYKYYLMYVSATKVESGGQLWRLIVNRLLTCLIFMQLVLMCVVSLDDTASLTDRITKAALCVPPIFLVVIFKIYCARRFDHQYDWYIPDSLEMAHVKIQTGDDHHNRLERRFGHPSLHQKLLIPMVHAHVRHLLPQVYNGPVATGETVVIEGQKVETEEVLGRVKIAALDEAQLESDPRVDQDSQSVFSMTTLAGGSSIAKHGTPSRSATGDTACSTDWYKTYLTEGPMTSRAEILDQYEMNLLNESQEQLLSRKPPATAWTYASRGGQFDYSYQYMASGPTLPGLEYPPGSLQEYREYDNLSASTSWTPPLEAPRFRPRLPAADGLTSVSTVNVNRYQGGPISSTSRGMPQRNVRHATGPAQSQQTTPQILRSVTSASEARALHPLESSEQFPGTGGSAQPPIGSASNASSGSGRGYENFL